MKLNRKLPIPITALAAAVLLAAPAAQAGQLKQKPKVTVKPGHVVKETHSIKGDQGLPGGSPTRLSSPVARSHVKRLGRLERRLNHALRLLDGLSKRRVERSSKSRAHSALEGSAKRIKQVKAQLVPFGVNVETRRAPTSGRVGGGSVSWLPMSCNGQPTSTRCYIWYREYAVRGSSIGEKLQIKMTSKPDDSECRESSSRDGSNGGYYAIENGESNQAQHGNQRRYPGATSNRPKSVDRLSQQIRILDSSGELVGTDDPCLFNPRVDFGMTSTQAGANPTINIRTRFVGSHLNDIPIREVGLHFPKGIKIDTDAAQNCEEIPVPAPQSQDVCQASRIGSIVPISDVFSKKYKPDPGALCLWSPSCRGHLDNLDFSANSHVLMGPVGPQTRYGDNVSDTSVVGYLWLVVNAQIAGVIDVGDDIVMGVRVRESSPGNVSAEFLGEWHSGQWNGISRTGETNQVPGWPVGTFIAIEDFKLVLNGGTGPAGDKLLTNPGPGECRDGDRAFYSALHTSWPDDEVKNDADSDALNVGWRPDIPQNLPPVLPGHTPTDDQYVQLVWSSGGAWADC